MCEETLTFWDHLEVLRHSLLKILAASVVMGILAFCMKEPLFDVVLAPSRSSFVTYSLSEQNRSQSISSTRD